MDRPSVGPDEVLVQVRAAGLDRGTWHLMTGTPYLMRIMGFGLRGPRNTVPGFDVAGVVIAITMHTTRGRAADLEALRPLLESGQVTPALDRILPLAQAADAIRHLVSGQARGKIAITT